MMIFQRSLGCSHELQRRLSRCCWALPWWRGESQNLGTGRWIRNWSFFDVVEKVGGIFNRLLIGSVKTWTYESCEECGAARTCRESFHCVTRQLRMRRTSFLASCTQHSKSTLRYQYLVSSAILATNTAYTLEVRYSWPGYNELSPCLNWYHRSKNDSVTAMACVWSWTLHNIFYTFVACCTMSLKNAIPMTF